MPAANCLILSGGWEGHRPRECAQLFIPALQAAGLHVRHEGSLEVLNDRGVLMAMRLIVPNWTMGELSAEQERNLCDAVSTGVGGWHGGMGDAFRASTNYQFMTGGQFVSHPGGIIDYRVEIADPDHPVTRGLDACDVKSEQYYMHVDPSNHVLATTRILAPGQEALAGTTMPVAWVRRWGEGRVFYCSVGHAPRDLELPTIHTLVRRGLLWAANVL